MTPDRPTPLLKVDEVMRDIEDEVRRARRERLLAQGGASGYADPAVYASVDALLRRALDQHTLLLPDLISGDDEWRLATHVRLSSHRPLAGPILVWIKRRALLPLMRWLFDFSVENFRRQQRVNDLLISCVEALAIDNAQLREELQRRQGADHR
jgi:hypothetical protein